MKTKELIKMVSRVNVVGGLSIEVIDEITQKLLEHNELRKLAYDAVDPLIELFNFLIAISEDYQTGDINYGRE